MNFNDLRVKLTNNQNYKSLSENGQKELNALLNSYESLHNKVVTEFGENIKRVRESEVEKANRRAKWGTFLAFTPLGLTYNGLKGLSKGITNMFSGLLILGGQFANNVGKMFEFEGRFGNDFSAWSKELSRDFIYTILDPIYSVGEGVSRGALSFENILGITSDEEFNSKLRQIDTAYERERYKTLYGENKGSFFPSWVDKPDQKQKVQGAISKHDYDWSEEWAKGVATTTNWVNKNIVEPALKNNPLFLGVGYGMEELGMTKEGEFATGTAESMGRMIPAIAASYYGVPPELTKAYFFSTTFGGAYSEAIEKGADIRSAYDYAYSVASIETLTEEIGGVQLGKILPSNILKSAIEEGSEELISELMSAGVEHIISGEDATNEDILERGVFAVLGGAISGGVFAGGGQYMQNRTVQGSSINLHNEIVSIYQENNGDYAKTEKSLRKTLDQVLRSYNSENRILNNYFDQNGITPEQRLEAKKQFLNEQTIAKHLIEYNEKTGEFQLTKKGVEMTTDLEGYMGDSNKNAYSSTLYGLEDTIATKITNKELTSEQQDVMKLSKMLGSDVVFFTDSDTSINGFFKDGIVYINTESKKSSLINFTHELTHSLEGTKEYDTLKNFIMKISETNEILKAKMEELGLTKESIIKEYWDQISKLNNIESRAYLVASEYVAFAMSEVILKDKASIESLTKNKTIGRKILNWIKEKIADIKTPKTDIEKAFLKDLKHAKNLYEEALGLGYRKGLKISEVDKRFSFIGEMGIENYITSEYINGEYIYDSGLDSVAKGLKDAKKMFDDGFSNQEILEKTGWYFSKDGNWKFEISDKEVSVKKEFEIKLNEIIENEGVYAFHLSEILNNDKLYKLYPSLENLDVYLTFEKNEDFSGYFSSGDRKKIVLNIDTLNKNNKGTEVNKKLESYKKDLKTLEEIRKVFDTNKNKAIELSKELETFNNTHFMRMIFETNEGDFEGVYKDGLFVSFTRDINGIDFLIKNTEINIKNHEELFKTVKKVDGEHFILPTLLHEIQHYIQTVELWSDGGNLKDGLIYMIQDFLRKNKMVDSFNEMSENDREDFLFETLKNYPTIAQRFYNYLMFLGELEARTVEKNRTLSQEEINNAKDISHEDNAIVKDSSISYLNPLDNFYYSLAMKEMLLGFNKFERPNILELENNKDIYDDELKKSLDKAIDFYNSDIRYSIKIGDNEIAVDKESINDDLVALHNIGENNLIKTIELGGFPMPSIAVTKPNMDHEGYGEITVIFGKDTIDPKKTTKNKVWSGDKWTSTFPQIEYEIDVEVIRKLGEETGLEVFDHQGYRVERMLINYGLEGTVESIASNPDTKEYFEKNPPKAGLTVKEYLTEVIGNAILNTGIRNNVDIFTNAGNRRSFSQTHYTVSLENILKSMINSETQKGVFYGGTGSMAASNMKNYRSINEIKRDIWKIVDENTTNAQKIELENQLLDVVGDILDNKKYVDRNRFIAFDNAETILRELGGDGVNKTNIEKWYKEYQINGSQELTNKIIQLFENLRNKYIRYFESKPERIVNLSEIKKVLLPKETQQKLINLLNENNIPYEVYGEEGRKTHIENMKDIRFSKTIDSEGRKLTVEQEEHFKDSKVVDEKGRLQVVYHGTNSKFNEFAFSKIDKSNPKLKGFWFINNKQNAYQYGNNIKEGYVNITKPLSLEDKHISKEQYTNFLEYVFNNDGENKTLIQQKDFKENISELYDSIESDYELINYIQSMYNEDSKISRFNEILKEKTGYDGTIFEDGGNTIAISLSPNQFKAIDNLTPTSDGDIRYSRNVDNGIDNKKEIKRLDNLTKRTYDNYEKSDYEKATTKRTRYINDIDFNELGKKNNGKKIVELIKELQRDYEVVIKKNHTRSEIYNHMLNNVLQEIIIQLESNYETTGFLDYNKMINGIESAIISTMPYVDDTYTMNEKTKTNPKGLQYTKLIHHGFRDLYNAKTQSDYNKILKNKNFDSIWNLFDGLIKLNVADKASVDLFKAGLKSFKNATHVEQRNSMSLRSGGTHVETIPVVLEQNNRHIDNVLALIGKALLDSKDGKKGKYSRDGLLGDLWLLDKFSPERLDMYAVGNIYGLHMEDSTGKIMVKRIEQAQRQQLEVSNAFYDYFEKDGYLKQNENKIGDLEKEVSTINNLVDSDNKPVVMPNSQVIRLRDTLKREIIRTRLIENKHRGGEISNHFKDNGIIYIDDNTSDRRKNIGNRREVKIVNLIALFNEVDTIVREHDFMENYSKKTRGFYALLYEYENARFKDIRGLELTNDQVIIDSLSQKEIDALVDGLNDGVDLTNIYVPTRTIGSNKASGAGAFNINNVIDLGIDDGLVMGITESLDAPAIDSINLNVPGYMRSVANYYGLYRIVNDLNILFEKGIELPDGSRTTLANKTNQISPYIIPYFEKLLRDMSGYRVQSDSTKETFNRGMGIVKRNFFKASLGGNIKVIATQFASAFTLATIHGDYKGTRAGFTMRMFSNMVKRGSKTKAKYLLENSEIYKDRARNSTYEVSEATKNEFLKGKLTRFTEFLMKGINVTDSMINRAFFITLVEEGYSQEEALRITEEGMNRYQSSGLAITKNQLLRTEHEVLRLFMKFLSEPMKMTSNIEDSQKHLAIIDRFEKNKDDIFQHFDNIVENETNTLNELNETREEIQEKLAKEKDAKKIEALEKEKDKVEKDITKQEKVVETETENANDIKSSIENVISQKAQATKLLAKRVTAFTVSVTYQALLGMLFGLLIRGGIKDKDEDEAMWKFLSKQFGWQLAGEMIGMFPFVRDIYGLIVDGYDADRIGEFQAFNNLGNAVGNLWRDIANGGDFNYGKHLRAVALYLGQSLGIPTRQIERLFTSPASWFAQSWSYNYKSATGQFIAGSELKNAIRDGNTKLVETIMKDKMNQKNVLLTHATSKEVNRLATNGVIVSPSGVPNTFTIDGIEYENDKDKFSRVYNNASFVIEKIISQGSYKRLNDEYKGKLIKAIFNYYYNLAKQEVSGVEIFKKDRVYTLNQAFSYFNGRIPYYLTLQRKDDAKKRRAN